MVEKASTGRVLVPEENQESRDPCNRERKNNATKTLNEDGCLRILYNNCNGLQPGKLLKEKIKQKMEKKRIFS